MNPHIPVKAGASKLRSIAMPKPFPFDFLPSFPLCAFASLRLCVKNKKYRRAEPAIL
jgi:hypothetical protein